MIYGTEMGEVGKGPIKIWSMAYRMVLGAYCRWARGVHNVDAEKKAD